MSGGFLVLLLVQFTSSMDHNFHREDCSGECMAASAFLLLYFYNWKPQIQCIHELLKVQFKIGCKTVSSYLVFSGCYLATNLRFERVHCCK